MKPLLYVLIGAGLAVAIVKLLTRKKSQENKRLQERQRVVSGANVTNDITGVKKGGVLKLPPFGTSKLPIETYVVTRHRYDDGGAPWFELVCQHGRRELLVEYFYTGSRLVITGGFEDENPSLTDLGLTEADLVRFDEDEKGSFTWDGTTWLYEESGEVNYYADARGNGEAYYGWTFVSEDGHRNLSVEKWEGERGFPVYHLWKIDERQVEVFDAGDGR